MMPSSLTKKLSMVHTLTFVAHEQTILEGLHLILLTVVVMFVINALVSYCISSDPSFLLFILITSTAKQ
jgi:hypothetical protein